MTDRNDDPKVFEIDIDRMPDDNSNDHTNTNGDTRHTNGIVKPDEKKKPTDDDESGADDDKPEPTELVSFGSLFRFAGWKENMLILFGTLGAIVHGGILPAFAILFGEVIDDFANESDFIDQVQDIAVWFCILGVIAFVSGWLQVGFYIMAATRQACQMRVTYFRALLRQEAAFFDSQASAALTSRIAGDIPKIQDGISDKLGSLIQFGASFLGGFIIGFVYSWELTLVVLAVSPLMIIGGILIAKVVSEAATGGQDAYAAAGGVAGEVLHLIRVVMAFGTQRREADRYSKELEVAKAHGKKSGTGAGVGFGFFMFIMMASYALAFWYGGLLVRDGDLSAGDVTTVFFAVIIGAMALGQMSPGITALAAARGAASFVFKVIDRTPEIDSLSTQGQKPEKLVGDIKFENVQFAYPTRPLDPVFDNFSLHIKPGETVALVGESGCGKSTTMMLLERFYDTNKGSVSVDGVNVKDLNVQWLRNSLGLVNQTPTLFPVSVFENIAMGKDNATKEEVEAAAKMANAHNFITSFPEGYDTNVGSSGTQLSGGQRQRIAIARALIKNPQILLLDEATSALDNESEAIVQEALDEAGKDRTTLMIAHRLSTVQTADRIVVLDKGTVLEQGSHEELMAKQTVYFQMVQSQHRGSKTLDADAPEIAKQVARQMSNVSEKEIEDENQKEQEVEEEGNVPGIFMWAVRLGKPERRYVVMGSLCGFIEGLIWPAFAIVFGEVLAVMAGDNDAIEVRNLSFWFLGFGILSFLSISGKTFALAVAGEELTYRLRQASFWAIISQELKWFDKPKHNKDLLTDRLASDAAAVKNLVGERIGLSLQLVVTLVSGIAASFYFCWRVSFIVLAMTPLMAISGAINMKIMSGFDKATEFEESGRFSAEAVENIRTVAALGRLNSFLSNYVGSLKAPIKNMYRRAHIQGLAFGFGEMMLFGVYAVAFAWGAEVVDQGYCDFGELMKCISTLLFAGMMAGSLTSMMPDFTQATKSASRMYRLIASVEVDEGMEQDPVFEQTRALIEQNLRRASEQRDNDPETGSDELALVAKRRRGSRVPGDIKPDFSGKIEFVKVRFAYPSRPEVNVLDKLSLTIPAGSTVALVGPSGCGKSTLLSLLETFYFVNEGAILIDGVSIRELDRDHLRKATALVAQDAELFSASVRDNIAYGLPPESVTEAAIIEAAKQANAHDFIMEFSDQYDTVVGPKGMKLSGGQRQRIAIARALIRSSSIKFLLLDEATSALDTHNEVLVHEALDKARAGRTAIIVAHRLSTVQNADAIAVIQDGKVVEMGRHEDLMEQQGAYYHLVHQQQFMETSE
eukprot:m.129396 g.129396  ORF g.129396 m.129396 type:complete len:1316 (+) comp23639_c0_seq1:107-4054(+)